MLPVFSLCAWSGTGKSQYLEGLIACLKARGLRVAAVKHDGHGFQMDTPGKDTWRLAQAGADVVAIASPTAAAVLSYRPTPLSRLVESIRDVDLILIEGDKSGPWPRIALYRAASGKPLAAEPEDCLAVVSDVPLAVPCPLFPLDDPAPLAEFLCKEAHLCP